MARDLRFRADALAGGDRRLEHAVQNRPRGAGLPRDPESRPDLAEHLALAQGEGLEAGGDAEEVARRVLSLADEASRRRLREVEAAPLRDEPGQALARPGAFRDAVDLAAVAGRDDDRLGHEALAADPVERFADLVAREGDALAHGERGGPEVPAEQQQSGFAGGGHRNRCAALK